MLKARKYVVLIVAIVIATGAWAFLNKNHTAEVAYRFGEVRKGNVEAAVSATGALSAVKTVQVGTQVSGQVAAIYVDFNDRVKAGQLLARIDATLAQQTVREAEANLARSGADLEQAQREFERNQTLHASKVVTDKEMNAARYALQIAQASMRSAQVSVERARQNLSYTNIYAPVDGIVIERNVEPGQTVAASLSAPQLFLIAQDLSQMQILASVDESDIGSIHEGQDVHFTVQAYEREEFTGNVKQVRLQSATTENVVSYTVVVDVQNPEGKLLPGMTATAEFVTGAADNVLTVPNAALRFNPTGERSRQPRVWVFGADQKPVAIAVKTGVTDGRVTEVNAADLKPGMQIITGTSGGDVATNGTNGSPLQGTQQSSGPRPPGAF